MEGSNKRHNKYINIKQLNVTQIVLIQFNHHWLSGQRITNSRLLCVTILFHHLVYVCVLHLNCIYLLHYPLKCQPHKMVKHKQKIHRLLLTNCFGVFDRLCLHTKVHPINFHSIYIIYPIHFYFYFFIFIFTFVFIFCYILQLTQILNPLFD